MTETLPATQRPGWLGSRRDPWGSRGSRESTGLWPQGGHIFVQSIDLETGFRVVRFFLKTLCGKFLFLSYK